MRKCLDSIKSFRRQFIIQHDGNFGATPVVIFYGVTCCVDIPNWLDLYDHVKTLRESIGSCIGVHPKSGRVEGYETIRKNFDWAFARRFACRCSKGDDKAGDKKGAAAGTALVAETESEKAWLAWQVAACKCKDLACASASGSARIPVEKKYPDSYKEKNIGKIIKAANACLTKAMEPPKQP